MHQKFIAHCLIFMMVMNSLLVATSGATLCLHDHNFGHLVTSEHSEHGGDCHSDEATPERNHSHSDDANNSHALEKAPHCFDIIMQFSDEPVRRVAELIPVKKPLAHALEYYHFEPARKVFPVVELRFVSRAPPISCGALEQCVRKTVLRI